MNISPVVYLAVKSFMNHVYYVDINKGSLLCLRFTNICKLRTGMGGEWENSPVRAFRQVILSCGFHLISVTAYVSPYKKSNKVGFRCASQVMKTIKCQ